MSKWEKVGLYGVLAVLALEGLRACIPSWRDKPTTPPKPAFQPIGMNPRAAVARHR